MAGGAFRILLAEDAVVNQFVATHLFQEAGIDVTVAADGREAVAAALREPFDLVLMDMQMPELDGVSATEEIRRREPKLGRRTPIVAMTARTRKEDRVRCEVAGMDGFLNKPLSLPQLVDCLHDLRTRGLLPSKASASDDPPMPETTFATSPTTADAILEEVAEMFRATCVESLNAIKHAAADGDAAALENSAHSLKGAASCVGEDRLVELLYELELMGSECRLDNTAGVVPLVEAEIQRVLR